MRVKVAPNFHAELIRRDKLDELVGFHAVYIQAGAMTIREARLVVLPKFQGQGIGPQLRELVGAMDEHGPTLTLWSHSASNHHPFVDRTHPRNIYDYMIINPYIKLGSYPTPPVTN